MASRRRCNPDHYQTHPDPVGDEAFYRESVRRLRVQWSPRVTAWPGRRGRERFVRAGQPLDRDVAVVCMGCRIGIGFQAGTLVTPCPTCRSDCYEVIS
jgi:hypothetical protein